MCRETLNGNFDPRVPPPSARCRPSKAAIVSSSIATVNAAARHHILAAQTLRSLAEQLRRQTNGARVPASCSSTSPSAPTCTTLSYTPSSRSLSSSSTPTSRSRRTATRATSLTTVTMRPLARGVLQLQDNAASIKRARSGSALASAHGFYMPSPIHTAIPVLPPSAQWSPTNSHFAFSVDTPPASPWSLIAPHMSQLYLACQ
ncbi:hypothetical protein B0H14DRAFT_54987 [Mycena olivaceomarginata]|nr:hypothetical protein B0H14DRAFT_54987 [Mycena olivaceomarginata]